MPTKEENELLKMVIETQASRILEQEKTIQELQTVTGELVYSMQCAIPISTL